MSQRKFQPRIPRPRVPNEPIMPVLGRRSQAPATRHRSALDALESASPEAGYDDGDDGEYSDDFSGGASTPEDVFELGSGRKSASPPLVPSPIVYVEESKFAPASPEEMRSRRAPHVPAVGRSKPVKAVRRDISAPKAKPAAAPSSATRLDMGKVAAHKSKSGGASTGLTQPGSARGLTNMFKTLRTGSKRFPEVVHFTPVGMEDYRKVRKRRAAIARGEVVPHADHSSLASSSSASSSKRPRSHVSNCTCPACRKASKRKPSGPLQLLYKMNSSGIVLVHATLKCHGFKMTNKDNYNVMWTSSHLKSYVFQGLRPWQKVNQFPRSFEATRKDSLARNVTKMIELHGKAHFGFIPESYVLPADRAQLLAAARRNPDWAWIVKPSTSSQGKGIFITQRVSEASLGAGMEDDGCTISRYIHRPLLLDGHKFDLRIYVGVTSFNPLRIYVHESGLARFATERYSPDPSHFDNLFMHLTNYSVNKSSDKFVANTNPDEDDVGHKWSLAALYRRLAASGIDVEGVKEQINDLIIKTLLSIEPTVTAASNMFVPHNNCFELFGFDVMLDADLTPWLLEVNFSPSLNCDAPLDHRLKSCLLSDMLTLAGIASRDARADGWAAKKREQHAFGKPVVVRRSRSANRRRGQGSGPGRLEELPGSGDGRPAFTMRATSARDESTVWSKGTGFTASLSAAEKRVLKETKEELERRGGFTRIFPSHKSYSYRPFFEEVRPLNDLLADHLFHLSAKERAGEGEAADVSREAIRMKQAKHARAMKRAGKASRRKGR